MPWEETSVQSLRMRFLGMYTTGKYSVTDLCVAFGISRVTGHRLIRGYNEEGVAALYDHSRAPLSHPNSTPPDIVDLILSYKHEHPRYGPKKIRAMLIAESPDVAWPTTSTFGEILKRAGLVISRPRRGCAGLGCPAKPLDDSDANSTWCADYKGQFPLGNREMCYPLTITDASKRMILCCHCMGHPSYDCAMHAVVATFRRYGLPLAIRSDNGGPFAGNGLGGLTRLSVSWIKQGIRLDRIDKGHPEQNGRHERMHKELKAAVASPPAYDMVEQQERCDRFVEEYNYVRPHEGIGLVTPASLYTPSSIQYTDTPLPIEYPSDVIVRTAKKNGYISFRGHVIFISECLAYEPVGLKPIDDDRYYLVCYSTHPLAVLDTANYQLLTKKEANLLLRSLYQPLL